MTVFYGVLRTILKKSLLLENYFFYSLKVSSSADFCKCSIFIYIPNVWCYVDNQQLELPNSKFSFTVYIMSTHLLDYNPYIFHLKSLSLPSFLLYFSPCCYREMPCRLAYKFFCFFLLTTKMSGFRCLLR